MRFRHAAIIFLAIAAIVGGGQFRVAKVCIKKPNRPRTVFRVFAPGRHPEAIAHKAFDLAAGEDFIFHFYDWYGFRELDGFGVATR